MTRFLAKRLGALVLILLLILMVTFVIFYIFPANPAQSICGKGCTATRVATIDHQLGLDRPLYVQFAQYIKQLFAGTTYGHGAQAVPCPVPCLGFSFQNSQPVTSLIAQRFPVSLSIALGAAVLWLAFGVSAGVVAALRRDTWLDKATTTVALGGVAIPIFVIAIAMLYVFASKLHVLPYPQYVSIFQNPGQFFAGMIMPWCALAAVYAAIYTRLTRASMIDVMEQEYITTARAKGLPEHSVVIRHGLRSALTPVVTIFGIDLGALLGGAVLVEQTFGLPGLGQLFIDAVGKVDIPVITAITLLVSFFVVFANLVVDVVYMILDPKVRIT